MKTRMAMVRTAGKAELIERDLPAPGPTEVLVTVKASSICGGDLHIYRGRHPSAPLPMALGHELAGQVVETGSQVNAVAVGDRVTVEPVIACGTCPSCRRGDYGYCDDLTLHYRQGYGAMADYFLVSQDRVYVLPPDISYEAGALIEPLAVAVHAVRRARVGLGHRVAIVGGGPIGILIGAVCRVVGSSQIVVSDKSDARLEVAHAMGATRTINATRESIVDVVRELGGGQGADRSFECVGLRETVVEAMTCLRKGGIATIVGIFETPTVDIPANLFVSRELTVQGAQGYCWDYDDAVALTSQIHLAQLISHRFSLADIDDAMKTALNPIAQPLKVLVRP